MAGQVPGPGPWEHRTQWEEDFSSTSHLPAHAQENLVSVPSEEPKVCSHLGGVARLVRFSAPQSSLTINKCFQIGTLHCHTSTHTHTNSEDQRTQSPQTSEPSFVPGVGQDPMGATGMVATFVNLAHIQTHMYKNILTHAYTQTLQHTKHEHKTTNIHTYINIDTYIHTYI